jgi:7-cyano-7-deazaguanine synthase in queuosine biosynthesis
MAKAEGIELVALTVDYGQRHRREIQAARRIAKYFNVSDHRTVKLNLRPIGGSALTDSKLHVPEQRSLEEIGEGIPPTYVPARNSILLSYALGLAEATGSDAIYIAANAVDYSIDGKAEVWVRTPQWTRLMPIKEFCELPEDQYQTLALDRRTLQLTWSGVTGRFRHDARGKRCFVVRLERGQGITITEDHSIFTIDPTTSEIVTIKGSALREGTPIVVPFDLGKGADAWRREFKSFDTDGLPRYAHDSHGSWSIIEQGHHLTNRLRRTYVPKRFPLTDEFLYIVGLWLAEGGKEHDSQNTQLRFSVGGVPGAVDAMRSYFGQFGVNLTRSPANAFDYAVSSSVFTALFGYLGLFGTSKKGEKTFPRFFWNLSQRQRRFVIAGLWDGDGSHVFKHQATLSQKSHRLIQDMYHCLVIDGIFPIVKDVAHGQRMIVIGRARDFHRFATLYPLKHPTKREAYQRNGSVRGRDQATGLWKCPGLWTTVASASLPPGMKTHIYNVGGKYDTSFRAQRSAFSGVASLRTLAESKLAFLRVVDVRETREDWMFDLSVEHAENFVANGVLAHNSGYPDCRPEYYEAFQEVARLGTKRGVEGDIIQIRTPLIQMSKADIVRKGEELGVPWELTWSCYLGGTTACGVCDSCQLRLKGFREAGVKDPLPYASRRKRAAKG